jgi:hypothetical protein
MQIIKLWRVCVGPLKAAQRKPPDHVAAAMTDDTCSRSMRRRFPCRWEAGGAWPQLPGSSRPGAAAAVLRRALQAGAGTGLSQAAAGPAAGRTRCPARTSRIARILPPDRIPAPLVRPAPRGSGAQHRVPEQFQIPCHSRPKDRSGTRMTRSAPGSRRRPDRSQNACRRLPCAACRSRRHHL